MAAPPSPPLQQQPVQERRFVDQNAFLLGQLYVQFNPRAQTAFETPQLVDQLKNLPTDFLVGLQDAWSSLELTESTMVPETWTVTIHGNAVTATTTTTGVVADAAPDGSNNTITKTKKDSFDEKDRIRGWDGCQGGETMGYKGFGKAWRDLIYLQSFTVELNPSTKEESAIVDQRDAVTAGPAATEVNEQQSASPWIFSSDILSHVFSQYQHLSSLNSNLILEALSKNSTPLSAKGRHTVFQMPPNKQKRFLRLGGLVYSLPRYFIDENENLARFCNGVWILPKTFLAADGNAPEKENEQLDSSFETYLEGQTKLDFLLRFKSELSHPESALFKWVTDRWVVLDSRHEFVAPLLSKKRNAIKNAKKWFTVKTEQLRQQLQQQTTPMEKPEDEEPMPANSQNNDREETSVTATEEVSLGHNDDDQDEEQPENQEVQQQLQELLKAQETIFEIEARLPIALRWGGNKTNPTLEVITHEPIDHVETLKCDFFLLPMRLFLHVLHTLRYDLWNMLPGDLPQLCKQSHAKLLYEPHDEIPQSDGRVPETEASATVTLQVLRAPEDKYMKAMPAHYFASSIQVTDS